LNLTRRAPDTQASGYFSRETYAQTTKHLRLDGASGARILQRTAAKAPIVPLSEPL